MTDLFPGARDHIRLEPGATLLGGFALPHGLCLLRLIAEVAASAPFRHYETPDAGRMSVAMTNAGSLGWVSDRRGYRYETHDPHSGQPWPSMPPAFLDLAQSAAAAAGFAHFEPEACLINRYLPSARLSLHQDRDERNLDAPIVSVSLGVDALFLWGGQRRSDRPRRIKLHHGDVVVWGGPARLAFHGANIIAGHTHPLTGGVRYNLTFRCVA